MSEPTIEDYYVEDRTFPPAADFVKDAVVSDQTHYDEATKDYEGFWARQARELISWDQRACQRRPKNLGKTSSHWRIRSN